MGVTMAAEKIDPSIQDRALRLLRGKIGGDIKGGKLYPMARELLQLVPPCEPVALSRRSYIAQVAAQQEGNVVEALRKAGLDAWCPVMPKMVRLNALKRKTVNRPMMPGYIFPIFDEARDNWEIIQREQQGHGIKGIIRLFKFGERPVPVPDAAIACIHERELQLRTGGLSRILAQLPAAHGDWVQIIEHPSFSGLIGHVVGASPTKWRIVVELDIFGQKTPVSLNADQVRLVS